MKNKETTEKVLNEIHIKLGEKNRIFQMTKVGFEHWLI